MSARTVMLLSILPSILPFRQDTDHESRLSPDKMTRGPVKAFGNALAAPCLPILPFIPPNWQDSPPRKIA